MMQAVMFISGVILVVVSFFPPFREPTRSAAPMPVAEELAETRAPVVLPPKGEALGMAGNEVWELRDGSTVEIAGPIWDGEHFSGNGRSEVIDQERGWLLTRRYTWREDGVSTTGESAEDVMRRRTDLKPTRHYDEQGYIDGETP
jgi:hypothetical protein